jgi:phospholipid-binding lipoprotein MlaA
MPFRYYGTGTPFEYEQIRMLYTRKRELQIAK